jgi:hypothetical protein
MVISLGPDLEAALSASARRVGTSPEALALDALRERFLSVPGPIEPRDEWERRLLDIASDCGVTPPREAFSSEEIYE